MKVLYLLSNNEMGGSAISLFNLLLNLDKSVFTPIVVLPKHQGKTELEIELEKNDIEYYEAVLTPSILPRFKAKTCIRWIIKYITFPFLIRRSIRDLDTVVQRVSPSIIHSNVGVLHEGFFLAQKYKIPHVWHLREYQTLDFGWDIYPSYNRFCSYLKDSYVITITEAIYKYFNLSDSNKAYAIYNGIFSKKDFSSITKKEKFFLMASRVSSEKGHTEVIKAFSKFSHRDEFKLVIAGFGDTEYINELKTLARINGCEERIEFLGFQKDIKSLIVKATALVVASYNEGFGRMTAEAAFCGTLVIGRNTAGTKEILNRTGGLLFDTTEEMIRQMEVVSSMREEEYNQLALNAQQVAVDNYSIENNVSRITELYKSITE